ncbi:MAG TPA: exodeoxyribonuclease V subunit gamma [bacterium]|nr:exodeoxyribonuclease V subunit gamma [bacterium]
MSILKGLNEQQREAARHVDGPIAVVAGAGTGKTRTIAHRAAYLIEERGVDPSGILAVTFTNKAAREMRERISKMIGSEVCALMTVRTIHSLCSMILREDFSALGRSGEFTICDSSDQTSLVRRALVENGFDPKKNDPVSLLWRIGAVKNAFPDVDREEFEDPVFARVWSTYNKALESANSVDFDDLLIFALKLLGKKEIRTKYQKRFRYIMVDEYQDVNGCQYEIIKRLAAGHGNLYVVGDDDQSIYGWRGAQVKNILNFEQDFKQARVVKLERNYRSTPQILEAAYAVIKNNVERRDKKLWTSEKGGDLVGIIESADETEEAARVVDYIIAEKHSKGLKYGDFAILYRTNAQSRLFEEKLMRHAVSYIMVGGTRFFERREIKDVTAYLRMVANPEDETAALRAAAFPPRGIGKTSLEKIRERAFEEKKPILSAMREAAGAGWLNAKAAEGLRGFVALCDALDEIRRRLPKQPLEMAKKLVGSVNFKAGYERAGADKNEAARRMDNIAEFVNAVEEYQRNEPDSSLEGFLENIALMTDERETELEQKEDSVTLMTLHSAKGLEFKYVVLVGAEEGFTPHERSNFEWELEEERRLFYVGMTRARKKLLISYAGSRRRYGESLLRKPSPYVAEIPPALLTSEDNEEIERAREAAAESISEGHRARMRAMLFSDGGES